MNYPFIPWVVIRTNQLFAVVFGTKLWFFSHQLVPRNIFCTKINFFWLIFGRLNSSKFIWKFSRKSFSLCESDSKFPLSPESFIHFVDFFDDWMFDQIPDISKTWQPILQTFYVLGWLWLYEQEDEFFLTY